MKLISIITVCYNARDSVQRTVSSVMGQNFENFEYIVVDGASDDGTLDKIRELERGPHRIVSEKDSGIYNAMNKGVRLAQGEYLLFLNAGDYLADEGVLREMAAYLSDAGIVYGNMIIDNGKRQRTGVQPDQITTMHLTRNTIWHPAAFIKRSLFLDHGFYDESFRISSDYEFFLREVLRYGATTKHAPVTVSVFNTDGISSDPAMTRFRRWERFRAQRRHLPLSYLIYSFFRLNYLNLKERLR